MKANELRIGNWVQNRKRFKKDDFDNETIEPYHLLDIVSGTADLKPIPLTEEWHNKFGVERDGFDSFVYKLPKKNNMNLDIVFSGDYVYLRQWNDRDKPQDNDLVTMWNKDLSKRDMFVHEFQNIFHALAGEELTIKE